MVDQLSLSTLPSHMTRGQPAPQDGGTPIESESTSIAQHEVGRRMSTPIRVLQVNGGLMDRGGTSAFMMNYYRRIDPDLVHFDFLVHGFEEGVMDQEIARRGGEIFHVPVKSADPIGNLRKLRRVMASGHYHVVHSHMDAMSAVVLRQAMACRVPVRIAHSHSTEHLTRSTPKRIMNQLAMKAIPVYATDLFACSQRAGRWLFGEDKVDRGEVVVVKNAIDLDEYRFDEAVRVRLREEHGLTANFVIGHIGGLEFQKNHLFLLQAFAQVVRHRPAARLILVGDGRLRPSIEAMISRLDLEGQVVLLGERGDVSELINMFDLLLLPSLFEGLGMVAIEAQANGLPCLLSDTITREVRVTSNVVLLPIDDTGRWAQAILGHPQRDSSNVGEKMAAAGYDIASSSLALQDWYLGACGTR